MKKIVAQIKNVNQQLRQLISSYFPGYIKKLYFKDIREAINAHPLQVARTENEILFIADLIPAGAICLDIGANRGDYVFALEYSGKCSSIYALEPIPELNNQLKNLFPKVNVCREAISDVSGTAQFNIPYINSRYFDTRGTLESFKENNQTSTRTIAVETITLDDFIKKYNISHLDLIKMDIEGHEYAALKGATEVLEHLRPVWMVEIEQRHHPAYPIGQIFAHVEKFGYKGYFFDGEHLRFRPLEEFSIAGYQDVQQMNNKKKYINNFLFVPGEKHDGMEEKFNNILKRF